jgi:internalin A
MRDGKALAAANGAYGMALTRIEECWLDRSQALDLTNLGLATLPPEIGRLTWLSVLELDDNRLTSLPDEFKNLTSLACLYLKGNQFKTVPSQLGSLEGLVELDLDSNQITTLPPLLWRLTDLRGLYVGQNKIANLPSGVGRLTKLQHLNLSSNKLKALPAEFGELDELEHVFLFLNEIASLPPELGRLTSLKQLDLFGNELDALPDEIVNLKALEILDLGENDFRAVPTQVRGLSRMTLLGLEGNQIAELPRWLYELPDLKHLFLHDNPSLKVSPSVLGARYSMGEATGRASAQSILDFYFGRKSGKSLPLNEVKLILVGRGGAGKTSTVRALRNQPFNEIESSTPGVSLCDWTMTECKGAPVTAHIWDFAGQVITHALHQFFFSVRSIYVLVLTGRENSERDDAEYWLRLVKAFGTDDKGKGPPVVVALNKWDVSGCRPKIDKGALQERYPFIKGFVEVDCKTGKGVAKLKSALCREVERLKWVREPFPSSWNAVRRALTNGRRKKAHLTYSDYRLLCIANGVQDEREQDSLAEILHNLGVALNYRNDPRLREATILQPEWLTKNVYSLVRRAEKQSGILKRDDIDAVLRYEKDSGMRTYLVRIMERFEIAYAPRSTSDLWLVPQALPDEQPKSVSGFRDVGDATRLLYTYPALPEGLVARAIVRLNELIEVIAGRKLQWASGVVIARNGARALIRTEPQDRQVTITITGPSKPRQQLAGLCQAEMRDIHAEIRGLDPTEETEVEGTWVSTVTLEKDERSHQATGVATKDRGTVLVDPAQVNNFYSDKRARTDQWKPTIFISYSKTDVLQRKRLEIQLKLLMNEGLIERVWHDRMIDPGDEWDPTIQRELKDADIVIILVSSAALSTEYIAKHEIPTALELHRNRESIIVPVILQACRWQKTQLGELNALPEKAQPLNSWKRSSDGWNNVADGIAAVCSKLVQDGTRKRKAPKRAPAK